MAAAGVSIGLLLLLLLVLSGAGAGAGAAVNKTSLGGIVWSTTEDEATTGTRIGDQADADADDDLDGGFSSFEGMLQWAIGHSDPAMLKEKANDVQRLSANELKNRQMEIKDLMEKLKMPSDAELMRIAIDDLNNSSVSFEDRLRALNELLILAESIDNANDLEKLGGLVAVVRELSNPEPDIRITSAWILGEASQNNELVQNQILAHGALKRLMEMVKSTYKEEAVKAMYAISSLIRNNDNAQELFYSEDGSLLVQDILSNSSSDVRLQKKAVFLVSDLVDRQLENGNSAISGRLSNRLFLKSVVGLTSSADLDLQEKALLVIRSLLQVRSTEVASDMKDYCNLEMVLERMRGQLEVLIVNDDEKREFARDVEGLRREVYSVFQLKLEKVGMDLVVT